MRTFAHACWLLRHFSNQCEGPLKSTLGVLFSFFLLRYFLQREVLQERNYRFIAELPVQPFTGQNRRRIKS